MNKTSKRDDKRLETPSGEVCNADGADVPKLFIFGVVGTLVNSGPRFARAFSLACQKAGLTPPDEDKVLSYLGDHSLNKIIDDFFPDIDTETEANLFRYSNEICDSLLHDKSWKETCFPVVHNLMRTLKDNAYEIGVFTGIRRAALDLTLRDQGLIEYMNPLYIAAKDNKRDAGKNSVALKADQLKEIVSNYRAHYDLTADQARRNIVVIGDSKSDKNAAQLNGLVFLYFDPADEKPATLPKASGYQDLIDFIEARQNDNVTGGGDEPPVNNPAPSA